MRNFLFLRVNTFRNISKLFVFFFFVSTIQITRHFPVCFHMDNQPRSPFGGFPDQDRVMYIVSLCNIYRYLLMALLCDEWNNSVCLQSLFEQAAPYPVAKAATASPWGAGPVMWSTAVPSSITGSEIVSLDPTGCLNSSSLRVSVLDSCYLKDDYKIIFFYSWIPMLVDVHVIWLLTGLAM